MKKGISELLFQGFLGDIKTGSDINGFKCRDLEQYQVQDGDIPSLFKFNYDKGEYDISCLNGIIIGISIKFDIDLDALHKVEIEEKKFDLGYKANFVDFAMFLNQINVQWEFDKIDTGQKSIGMLLPSKTKVMYSFEKDFFGFYQVVNFNLQLYNSIRASNSPDLF
ncbi:hypothetical protein [Chryseosolibacter indicus]|uniref:Uncharacterized protein n=1 Tax=Chryseosolibacter indicus TaxID=2782351 RepID=A0ABS5VZ00_9BACT|nr:hypothetical protein [Chryseosolibacter indicus]MBT1706466.1 hypothetical protein [Chryseosolibacter indicus]